MFPSFGQLVQPRGVSLHINCNLQHTEFTMYSPSRSSVFTQTYNYANLGKWGGRQGGVQIVNTPQFKKSEPILENTGLNT